jgi:predicted permease
MTPSNLRPPRLARWLLRARPLGSRRAEVEADLEEMFVQRAIRSGRFRAGLRYFVDVLSVWRWNPSGARLFREAAQDFAYGLRVFRRSPGTVATTIGGLALAIGVSTSIVTLLNATAFLPVGVADPESAIWLERAWKEGMTHGWSYADYLSLREKSRDTRIEASSLTGNSVLYRSTAPTLTDADAQRVRTAVVSGGYMTTFGARPLFGRILSVDDDVAGAQAVAVAGYTFWTRRLHADPAAVGRVVWLNGKPVTIVGVADRRFTGISDEPPALWMSFAGERALNGGPPNYILVAVHARKPVGVTIAQAEGELSALAAAVGRESTDTHPAVGVRAHYASDRPRPKGLPLIVSLVLISVGLVVLLACVNVANLQFASAFARQREIGVRLAIGASKARIVRQLVTESIALGWAAGAMGLVFAFWLGPVLANVIGIPITFDLRPDGRVYGFLVLVSCAAGIGAGLAPARYGTRGDLLTALKGDGARVGSSGRPGRPRAILIAVQAAASIVLLIVATLAARAAVNAARIDPGFETERLVAVSMTLGQNDAAKAYLDVALDRVRSLPGVQAASLTDTTPYAATLGIDFTRDGVRHRALLTHTQADYFSTLGLRIVRGRTYTEAEVATAASVAVVSESLARRLWGGDDPLGQVLEEFRVIEKAPPVTVIGVVSDTITARLHDIRPAAIYRPLRQMPTARMLVKTSGPPHALLPALRGTLQPIDPRVRVETRLVEDGRQEELETPRRLATVAGSVAALALVLAVIGIYGVTTFVTGLRTREIGVRLAVGASPADVVRLLLGESLRPIAIGLACGIGAATIGAQAFQGAMYGVTARDPGAFAAAAVVLLIAAVAAVYFPTRRASRLNPVVVLRQS